MFGTFPATDAQVANDSSVSKETKAETTEVVETGDSSADHQSTEAQVEAPDTAENDAVEETQDDTQDSEKPSRPRKGFERRIEKINQKLAQREQEIDYWRSIALKTSQPETVNQVPQATDRPKFSEFNDIEAYTEALTDWKISQGMAQFQAQTQIQSIARTYEQRLQDFKQQTPDFDSVMQEFIADYGDEQIPEIVEVAMDSEHGPALAYYLARNTEEVERLKVLPPRRRLLELGKIEDRLAKPVAPAVEPAKKISRAAPPVNPVKGRAPIETNDLADPNLSYTEWVRRRQAQLKKR